MKLIEQLVEYLRSRGSLTSQQVQRLVGKGFIAPLEEGPDAAPPPRKRKAPPEPSWEDLFDERKPPRKGRRKARSIEREQTLAELRARLTERFPDWERSLEGLVVVQGSLHSCSGWQQAVDGIGKCSDEELATALAATLAGDPHLASLL